MCEIYVKADPILYESRSRSLRIHGCVSKIRLENLCWDILAELAGNEGMTTNQLILRHQKEGERPSLAVVGTLPPVRLAQGGRAAA